MKDILDNPAWHALHSGNRALGNVTEVAAYFDPEVSPFVALAEPDPKHLTALHNALPFSGTVILVINQKIDFPDCWKNSFPVPGYQMIFDGKSAPVLPGEHAPVALEAKDIPQMLALTKLTNPGPFLEKTIDFGFYEGIFSSEKLVAMAGQRMNPYAFAEISAVCTHSDHLGKGYARNLMLRQVNRMLAAGTTPFLHVKQDNMRAIRIYESLGFKVRSDMYFYIMTKN